jgi:hypothetical protein
METYRTPRPKPHADTLSGFSLIELMLAMSLGIALSGAILQLLISESQLGLRVNRLLRERSVQQRTLALIRDDVVIASRISATPQLEQHACSLAGRLPVLHLTTAAGVITYSVGTAPSGIWRGEVLMRCGPSFDLRGRPSYGAAPQNRVVIDGIAKTPDSRQACKFLLPSTNSAASIDLAGSSQKGFCSCLEANMHSINIRITQELKAPQGTPQLITSSTSISRLT